MKKFHLHPKRQQDRLHLEALREFGCWACREDGNGWVYAEAHHPRLPGQGTGVKAPDRDAIPLCPRLHHNVQTPDAYSIHRNPIEFRQRYGTEAEIRDQVATSMARSAA